MKPQSQEDSASLLQAVGNGDRHAYEQLFRDFHEKVYRFVFRMLQDAQLADEVTSDTLLTVWTDAKRFRGQSAVSSWILGIARNKSLKALRSRKRDNSHSEAIVDDEKLVGNDSFTNPERRIGESMDLNLVSEAISQLSVDHQAVVRLTAVGHSCAEIAELVGCPRNTVKTRMFHARARLRAILGLAEVALFHTNSKSGD